MNIYLLNTLDFGIDLINIIRKQIDVKGIIGLSDRHSSDKISGFVYQKKICKELNIDFIEVENYELNSEGDKNKILELDIDILILGGWQRLIPQWLIDQCKISAIGCHGSPFGITGGRGRSPQNWALILGLDEFHISIFKIDKGIDSGEIIDTKKFTYDSFDNIRTSYHKVCMLTAQMIIKNVKNGNVQKKKNQIQQEEEAFYFPQRLPEDGQIDWNRNTNDVFNFIRALTKPYPGAYSKISNSVIKIWSASPFNLEISGSFSSGEIVKVFNKNEFIIKTKNGFLLVDEYECKSDTICISEGTKLESFPFEEQIRNIVIRHQSKYPELPLSPAITSLLPK